MTWDGLGDTDAAPAGAGRGLRPWAGVAAGLGLRVLLPSLPAGAAAWKLQFFLLHCSARGAPTLGSLRAKEVL